MALLGAHTTQQKTVVGRPIGGKLETIRAGVGYCPLLLPEFLAGVATCKRNAELQRPAKFGRLIPRASSCSLAWLKIFATLLLARGNLRQHIPPAARL